ncbi:MAG: hypothetical protein ACXVUL_11775 [Solirubrobacteraceae bacterium]|jgi:hypothetical protein
MQPPFQQSAASAHIDDLMRAAQSYRLAGVDRPRRRRRSVSLGAVRSALAPSMRKAQHA